MDYLTVKIRRMQHVTGEDRYQVEFGSLDDQIPEDKPVSFLTHLEFGRAGFRTQTGSCLAQPLPTISKSGSTGQRSTSHQQ